MTKRNRRRMSAFASLIALGLMVSLPAGAEPANPEQRARAAFEAGRALAAAGDYGEACSQFEKSLAFVDAIGTLYNLADCEEKRGHFARAQSLFSTVAERAHELGQDEREQLARERGSALDKQLSFLAIELAAPGATVSLDGRTLSATSMDAPIAVDPGKHQLRASAKGKKAWARAFEVPRAQLLLPVRVPPLEAVPSEPSAKPLRVAPKPVEATQPTDPSTRRSNGLALALGGVGLAASGAGAFLGWRYLSKNADAKDTCPSSYGCPQREIAEHKTLVDEARTARNFSYVGFGVGAAALTSAVVLFFNAGKEQPLAASAVVSDNRWLAAVSGKF